MTKIYMVVTADKYELPVFLGKSTKEVAQFLGIKDNTVRMRLYLDQESEKTQDRIVRVIIED